MDLLFYSTGDAVHSRPFIAHLFCGQSISASYFSKVGLATMDIIQIDYEDVSTFL